MSNTTPKTYSLASLNISKDDLDDRAVSVTKTLQKAGFDAYLVGGCVRDLLLGLKPKDFDVATNAEPEQVEKLFRHCRLIGRRFRLAHVHFGRHVIEVATFRGPHQTQSNESRAHHSGRLLLDNVFGTIEEDAWRRDFSVNALYLNPDDGTVIDFVGGIEDHQKKQLRLLGEPKTRYKEDPVRLLRALRFQAKLGFTLEEGTQKLIKKMAPLIKDIPPARLFDESIKLFLNPKATKVFQLLCDYQLFDQLFPNTAACLKEDSTGHDKAFIVQAMQNTEKRLAQQQRVAPYFLFATLLWPAVKTLAEQHRSTQKGDVPALHTAASLVLAGQVTRVALPRRITTPMKEVWTLQPRFQKRVGFRCIKFLDHPRFRAAYDFLLLRAQQNEIEQELATWWTEFQTIPLPEQKKRTRPKHYRKGRNKKPSSNTPNTSKE